MELIQREHGGNTALALKSVQDYRYYGPFHLSEQDANELANRLQVSKSIIIYNAIHLDGICPWLFNLHEEFRRNVLYRPDVALQEPTFNSKQMSLALEFYLQIDGQYHGCCRSCCSTTSAYVYLLHSGRVLHEDMLVSFGFTRI